MVSVWPFVDYKSELSGNAGERLPHQDRTRTAGRADFVAALAYDDKPRSGRVCLNVVKKNYYDRGIRIFWLDEAERNVGV